MANVDLGLWSFAVVLLLIAIRVPIAVALGLVAVAGVAVMRNFDVAASLIRDTPFTFASKWELSAIPMFLLMGAIAHNSGVSSALFRAARLWFSGLPGGLAVAANMACAGFAAASGSSVATAAAMGRLAIPEMLKQGYDKGLATGVVASAGTLGSLIPPSILFVLYGVFAQVSISKLLIAGILPGLLTAAAYTAMILIRCKLKPGLAPRLSEAELAGYRKQRWSALRDVWPTLLLILSIIGGLYGGIFTPTEAGAVGAFIAFAIGLLQGRMTFKAIRDSLVETLGTTAQLFFIGVGAVMYTTFLALTGMTPFLTGLIGQWGLDPLLLVLAASILYLILGMFLDPLGVMLLTLPVLMPMFQNLGLDLIWFGVLVVKYVEIGLLTPPVGFNVYVIKSVVGNSVPLETIFKGVGWFLVCEVFVVILLIAFPQISLFLPGLMR